MLNFNEDANNAKIELSSVVSSLHSTETKNKVNQKRIGRFKEFLSESQIADIDFLCTNMLREMNYPRQLKTISLPRRIYLESICHILSIGWKGVRAVRKAGGSL